MKIAKSVLNAAVKTVKALELAKRERDNAVREHAWFLARATKPYAWKWWRVGFQHVYGARFERADMTAIPGYDTLHKELCLTFPEFDTADGCERLWSFLMTAYVPMPKRDVLEALAVEMIVAGWTPEAVESFGFGANVAAF